MNKLKALTKSLGLRLGIGLLLFVYVVVLVGGALIGSIVKLGSVIKTMWIMAVGSDKKRYSRRLFVEGRQAYNNEYPL